LCGGGDNEVRVHPLQAITVPCERNLSQCQIKDWQVDRIFFAHSLQVPRQEEPSAEPGGEQRMELVGSLVLVDGPALAAAITAPGWTVTPKGCATGMENTIYLLFVMRL